MTLSVGLLINPWAGIGGPAGLKGSDGAEIVAEAVAKGANPQASHRVLQALKVLATDASNIRWYTAAGDMGEDSCLAAGLNPVIVGQAQSYPSSSEDTERLAKILSDHGIDVLLFAGGDGTARNIFNALGPNLPVVGIPAGVKMHSGIYALTPRAAAQAISMLANGRAISVRHEEVRDIDEVAFRKGIVKTRFYGELLVPAVDEFLQGVKSPGQAGEEDILLGIADSVIELLQDDAISILGPGSTTMTICDRLGLQGTLLGVDVLRGSEMLFPDISEHALFEFLSEQTAPTTIYITAIGGQGHVIGRGNQQLSHRILKRVGRDNLCIVASRQKIASLAGRPLVMDSGDSELDSQWAGPMRVICDYREQILYPMGVSKEFSYE